MRPYMAVRLSGLTDHNETWRLRIEVNPDFGPVVFAEERVNQGADLVRAHEILEGTTILLGEDEVRWLHEKLGEAIAALDSP